MTAAPPFAFPGSRALAGWWRQLAPQKPRGLWVAHLLLHRVEVLVRQTHLHRPDRFTLLVLDALALEPGQTPERLNERLHLGRQVVRQILARLAAEGLAQSDPAGGWLPTPLAQQARRQGGYLRTSQERRAFYFLEAIRPDQQPQFLDLNTTAALPWQPGQGWRFDITVLRDCVNQASAWKARRGFPAEVEELLGPDPELAQPDWQRVVLDQPEHLPAALVLVAGETGERLRGCAVHPKGWVLDASRPVLDIADWQALLPEVAEDPALEAWQQAWKAWSQPLNLPAALLDAAGLRRRDHRLQVLAPRPLFERIRSARGEVFRGEVWLLAGSERVRTAAMLEIIDTGAS